MFDFFFWRRELLPLPYTREIHCHLIPGVDDGSPDLAFTIKALSALENLGVEKVIFTPHFTNPSFLNYPENVGPLFDKVKEKVAEKDMDILCENYSFEYRISGAFEEMVDEGAFGTPECRIRPLKGNNLLVENGWSKIYKGFDELIEQLQGEGYNLIMAHPERYPYYHGLNGEHYRALQEKGIRFQCNILSFSGYYGATEKQMAYWMLEHGYVNYLGSDMHNSHHIQLIEKFLRSKDYAAIAEDLEDSISNDQL